MIRYALLGIERSGQAGATFRRPSYSVAQKTEHRLFALAVRCRCPETIDATSHLHGAGSDRSSPPQTVQIQPTRQRFGTQGSLMGWLALPELTNKFLILGRWHILQNQEVGYSLTTTL